jgi:hypothetical protein
VFLLGRGVDYGWPKCYFDGLQQKLVLAPEYGGDGGHTAPRSRARANLGRSDGQQLLVEASKPSRRVHKVHLEDPMPNSTIRIALTNTRRVAVTN